MLELALYRDLAALFRERVELFPAEALPGFAEASSNLALFLGGLDAEEDLLPGLGPWVRLVVRPVDFADDCQPEMALPAAAAIVELEDPELGPALVGAFQTGIGIANVDRAQRGLDALVLSLSLAGDVEITSARFRPPRAGDGVDLRYNLEPACAVVGDVFVVGTHAALVRELALGRPAGRETEPRERLTLDGRAVAGVIAANSEALVMQNMLAEGSTRERAEGEIGLLLGFLERLGRARPRRALRGGRERRPRPAPRPARERGVTPLAPFRPGVDGPWDRGAAWHLACRAGFGPAPAPGPDSPPPDSPPPDSIEGMLALGLEAALERLFAPRGHDPALVAGVQALLPTGEIEHLASWWMALILGGGDALGERMALVWHDHFATSHAKVQDVRLMLRQNELFRAHGLGDFRELLRLVAVDPAMLVWLDGDENRAGQPNENFARELLELFALGIGNYTEDDVREAARAFTGWGTLGRSFHHRPEHHDGGLKVIFGRRGPFDGEAALELVLEHPACPRWIARRLLTAFVTQSPSDGQIDEVAAALLEERWQVGATLRRLLASRLFFAPEQRRARIAAPVELVARSVRITGARLAPRRGGPRRGAHGPGALPAAERQGLVGRARLDRRGHLDRAPQPARGAWRATPMGSEGSPRPWATRPSPATCPPPPWARCSRGRATSAWCARSRAKPRARRTPARPCAAWRRS